MPRTQSSFETINVSYSTEAWRQAALDAPVVTVKDLQQLISEAQQQPAASVEQQESTATSAEKPSDPVDNQQQRCAAKTSQRTAGPERTIAHRVSQWGQLAAELQAVGHPFDPQQQHKRSPRSKSLAGQGPEDNATTKAAALQLDGSIVAAVLRPLLLSWKPPPASSSGSGLESSNSFGSVVEPVGGQYCLPLSQRVELARQLATAAGLHRIQAEQAIITALAANANIIIRLLTRSRQLAARTAAAEARATAADVSSADQVALGRYRAEAAALSKQLAAQRELPTFVASIETQVVAADGLLRSKTAGGLLSLRHRKPPNAYALTWVSQPHRTLHQWRHSAARTAAVTAAAAAGGSGSSAAAAAAGAAAAAAAAAAVSSVASVRLQDYCYGQEGHELQLCSTAAVKRCAAPKWNQQLESSNITQQDLDVMIIQVRHIPGEIDQAQAQAPLLTSCSPYTLLQDHELLGEVGIHLGSLTALVSRLQQRQQQLQQQQQQQYQQRQRMPSELARDVCPYVREWDGLSELVLQVPLFRRTTAAASSSVTEGSVAPGSSKVKHSLSPGSQLLLKDLFSAADAGHLLVGQNSGSLAETVAAAAAAAAAAAHGLSPAQAAAAAAAAAAANPANSVTSSFGRMWSKASKQQLQLSAAGADDGALHDQSDSASSARLSPASSLGEEFGDDSAFGQEQQSTAGASSARLGSAAGSVASYACSSTAGSSRGVSSAAAAAANAAGVVVLDPVMGQLHGSTGLQQVGAVQVRFRVLVERRVDWRQAQIAVQQQELQQQQQQLGPQASATPVNGSIGITTGSQSERSAAAAAAALPTDTGCHSSSSGAEVFARGGPMLKRMTALNAVGKHVAAVAGLKSEGYLPPNRQANQPSKHGSISRPTAHAESSHAASLAQHQHDMTSSSMRHEALKPETAAAMAADAAVDEAVLDLAGSAEGSLLLLLRWMFSAWKAGQLVQAPQSFMPGLAAEDQPGLVDLSAARYAHCWPQHATGLQLCLAYAQMYGIRWQSVRLAIAQVILEDQQALRAVWSNPAAVGPGAVQQLTAIKHLLQPLLNILHSSECGTSLEGALSTVASRLSTEQSNPLFLDVQPAARSGSLGRQFSGRQLACLAESALVGVMTDAEVAWLSWLLGQLMKVTGQLLQQGLPAQQQVLQQVLEYTSWAQQALQRHQHRQHIVLSQQSSAAPGQAGESVPMTALQQPLVLLQQQLAQASAQQLQQQLTPWINPATVVTESSAADNGTANGSAGLRSMFTAAPTGAPNGGMTHEQMSALVEACQKLAGAMQAAHQLTAADLSKFTGSTAAAAAPTLSTSGASTAAHFPRHGRMHKDDSASADQHSSHYGFQRRAATHAPGAAVGHGAAGPHHIHGSRGTVAQGLSAAPTTKANSMHTTVAVQWDATYWPLALAAAASRYSVVRAALADVFAACPGRSTATLTAVAGMLGQPLLLLHEQLQSMGIAAAKPQGDAWQLDDLVQQQQQQTPRKQQQQQPRTQLEQSSSIGRMWQSVSIPDSGSSSSSSGGTSYAASCHSSCVSSSAHGYKGAVGVASVLGRNFALSSYCSQQQQRLQLQHGRQMLTSAVPGHQQHVSSQLSRSNSLQSMQSQQQQQHFLQPRLFAAAAEVQVDFFPWPDMLLLQQQLWVGCCGAEMMVVLLQLLQEEQWQPIDAALPVARSVIELCNMLQSALQVWSEVLLPINPKSYYTGFATEAADLEHVDPALQQQRLQQERHRFQRRRQHLQQQQQLASQGPPGQQVSAHSAAMCRLMLGAVVGLQQMYVSCVTDSWSKCCAERKCISSRPADISSSGSPFATAAPGAGVLSTADVAARRSSNSSSGSSSGVVMCQPLSVMLNSLLMMRQEAENIEATLVKFMLYQPNSSHTSYQGLGAAAAAAAAAGAAAAARTPLPCWHSALVHSYTMARQQQQGRLVTPAASSAHTAAAAAPAAAAGSGARDLKMYATSIKVPALTAAAAPQPTYPSNRTAAAAPQGADSSSCSRHSAVGQQQANASAISTPHQQPVVAPTVSFVMAGQLEQQSNTEQQRMQQHDADSGSDVGWPSDAVEDVVSDDAGSGAVHRDISLALHSTPSTAEAAAGATATAAEGASEGVDDAGMLQSAQSSITLAPHQGPLFKSVFSDVFPPHAVAAADTAEAAGIGSSSSKDSPGLVSRESNSPTSAEQSAPASALAAAGPVAMTDLSGILSRGVDAAAAFILSGYRRNFTANFTAAVLNEFARARAKIINLERRSAAAAAAANGVLPAQFAGVLDAVEMQQQPILVQSAYVSGMKRIVNACTQELALISELLIKHRPRWQQQAAAPAAGLGQQQHAGTVGNDRDAALAAEAAQTHTAAAALPALAQLLAAAAWWGVFEGLQQLVLHQCSGQQQSLTHPELQALSDLHQQLKHVWAGKGVIPLSPEQLQQPSSILHQYSTPAAVAASAMSSTGGGSVTCTYVAKLLDLAAGSSDQIMGLLNGWIAAAQLTLDAADQQQEEQDRVAAADQNVNDTVAGVKLLDLLRLLRQRRHDVVVVGWLAALKQRQRIEHQQWQQQQRPQHLMSLLLLGQKVVQPVLGSWHTTLTRTIKAAAAAGGTAGEAVATAVPQQSDGVLYLTPTWLVFTTLFSSDADNETDMTKVVPLHSVLAVSAVPRAAAADSAETFYATRSTTDSYCSLQEAAPECDEAVTQDTTAAGAQRTVSGTGAAGSNATGGISGRLISGLLNISKRWQGDTEAAPVTTAAPAAASSGGVDATNTAAAVPAAQEETDFDAMVLHIEVLSEPAVEECYQLDGFAPGELLHLLQLMWRTAKGADWQLKRSMAADATISSKVAALEQAELPSVQLQQEVSLKLLVNPSAAAAPSGQSDGDLTAASQPDSLGRSASGPDASGLVLTAPGLSEASQNQQLPSLAPAAPGLTDATAAESSSIGLQPSHNAAAASRASWPAIAEIEHASLLRTVRCCLYGVLLNKLGKLLLYHDRLVFIPDSAQSASQQQGEAMTAADASGSCTVSSLAVVMPVSHVEHLALKEGWCGSWLVVSGCGEQLLLGGMPAELAAAIRADIMKLAAQHARHRSGS